jgi:hypothetical protein
LQAGDALVLRYSAELDGLPSMFLPALTRDLVAATQVEGLKVYVDTPTLTDAHLATRTENVTLVFEAGGQFSVPRLTLDWWNSAAGAVESVTVPALHISVPGPGIVANRSNSGSPNTIWRVVIGLGVILFLTWVVWHWYRPLHGKFSGFREAQRLSEKYAFKALIRSLGDRNLKVIYAMLLDWLYRLDPDIDVRQFTWRFGTEEFTQQIERLSRGNFDKGVAEVDWMTLRKGLIAARSESQKKQAMPAEMLPPLNP